MESAVKKRSGKVVVWLGFMCVIWCGGGSGGGGDITMMNYDGTCVVGSNKQCLVLAREWVFEIGSIEKKKEKGRGV
ncbi:unnamed protein product [Dovyalis caffra]|uniref:Uncharacterized protein n=1 Tax=Dovyalis caffra TaxID=77055 RepID=A0AAV1QRE0_9ROSI|nr:unnamed protein product [Dovyalis caffra]